MMGETAPASSTGEASVDTLTGIYAGIGRPHIADPRSGLLGRTDECRTLDQLVVGARAGRSGVRVLRGEAGIGKTTLLDYLAGEASGCRVVRTAGIDSEMELAYAGLHQFCTPMLGGLERLPAPQRDALGVAFGLQSGAAPDRFMVGLAVLGLLSEAAEEQPQVCLIDDAQWLDRVSAQTLAFVARRLVAERVALVFAVRDGGGAEVFPELPELTVRGLPDADALALLDAVVQGPVDDRVVGQIVAETRGNPLALIELPRGLTPAQLAGGFGLPVPVPLASGIEQVFLARVRALAPGTFQLLLAAAADPVGDATLLWRAAARLNIEMGAADQAEAAGLIEIGSRVRFRHPLVRSAVYGSASAAERRNIHLALADVTDAALDPDRRAWHRAHAAPGPDEAVAGELEGSAARAQARGGAAAAAAFMERAVALTPEPGRRSQRGLAAAGAKRDAGALNAALALLVAAEHGPQDTRRTAEVWRLRGHIALDLQRGAEASRLLLRAARALEPLDIAVARQTHLEALAAAMWAVGLDGTDDIVLDAARASRAAPPGPQPARPVDIVLDALALRFTNGFTAAAPALIRALDVLRRQSADEEAGRWLWAAGNNVSGIIAMELFDSEARHALGVGQVEAARCTGALVQLQVGLHYLAHTNLVAGELAAAAAQIDESSSISDATGSQPVAYTELALAAFRGREAEASALIRSTIRTATANGQGRIVSFATYASAVLYNGIGRYDAARDAALRVIDREVMGYSSLVIAELAEAASRTGDIELIHRALAWMRERTAATPTGWSRGIEARIHALASDGEDADRLYLESIALLGGTRLRAELARGHLLYGEWLRRERRRADARGQLGTAHEMLVEMGLEGFAHRARDELLATGATVRKRSISTREELSAQESHIARLASEGLSNPEIGAQLFLSGRTVEWHLRKVFTKLGISSRDHLRAALAPGGGAGELV
jgi:DNA-binding CsgD family transcriptional regulator